MERKYNFNSLWKGSIISIILVIWKARNGARCENIRISRSSIFATIWHFISEAYLSQCGSMWYIVEDLIVLQRLWVQEISRQAPRVVEVLWKLLPSWWIKVNTHGVAFGSSGLVSYVRVFKTSRSFVRDRFYNPFGVAFAFEAEHVVAIHVVLYATTIGWRKLWLKSDSTNVVTLFCTRFSSVLWRWYTIWVDCLKKIVHMNFDCFHLFG